MNELAEALRTAMVGDVRDDAYTRHLFSTDASMYSIEPLAVVFPRDAADVAAAVAVCAEQRVPVLPRGAGTSLAGQTVGRAVIIDTSRHMDTIVVVDGETRTARVQPGVVQDDLNRAAATHGLLFGPDTSTSNRATIGGMIGNNSAGSGSVVYGMTIDHVHSLDVVLSDASTATLAPVDDAEELAADPEFVRSSYLGSADADAPTTTGAARHPARVAAGENVTVSLPPALMRTLSERAEREGVPVSDLVARALRGDLAPQPTDEQTTAGAQR